MKSGRHSRRRRAIRPSLSEARRPRGGSAVLRQNVGVAFWSSDGSRQAPLMLVCKDFVERRSSWPGRDLGMGCALTLQRPVIDQVRLLDYLVRTGGRVPSRQQGLRGKIPASAPRRPQSHGAHAAAIPVDLDNRRRFSVVRVGEVERDHATQKVQRCGRRQDWCSVGHPRVVAKSA
jgi:hypothetical protein